MFHHIAFICTARVVIHRQCRSYHGSSGYLLASNHGSQGSIPGRFILICDGGIGQIFLRVLWFSLHSTSAPWSDFISSWYCVTLAIDTRYHHKIKHWLLTLSLRVNEVVKGLKLNKYGKSREVTSDCAGTKCQSSVVSVCVIYLVGS